MISHVVGTDVPVYSLAQTSRSGASQFEITQANGLTQRQKDHFFVPHRKDLYLLAFVRAGSSRHWIDMVPYTLKPDTLYFSAPSQVFLKEDGTFEATAVCFTQEFLDMEEARLFRQLSIIQNPHNGHELQLAPADVLFIDDLTGKLLTEFQHGQGWHNSMLLSYLRVLLIYLSRLYNSQFTGADGGDAHALLNRFRMLISDHFKQNHDVAAYAGMLHLSPDHFSELIKKQSGKTPLEHIHERLLMEAKRMLFHTDCSMKEIAFELGFEDASYFNRFFKRLVSDTPLSYRHTIREMYH